MCGSMCRRAEGRSWMCARSSISRTIRSRRSDVSTSTPATVWCMCRSCRTRVGDGSDTVFFQLEATSPAITATLDDAHLFVDEEPGTSGPARRRRQRRWRWRRRRQSGLQTPGPAAVPRAAGPECGLRRQRDAETRQLLHAADRRPAARSGPSSRSPTTRAAGSALHAVHDVREPRAQRQRRLRLHARRTRSTCTPAPATSDTSTHAISASTPPSSQAEERHRGRGSRAGQRATPISTSAAASRRSRCLRLRLQPPDRGPEGPLEGVRRPRRLERLEPEHGELGGALLPLERLVDQRPRQQLLLQLPQGDGAVGARDAQPGVARLPADAQVPADRGLLRRRFPAAAAARAPATAPRSDACGRTPACGERATGEELTTVTRHARESIDYWVNATVPTLNFFAPIGDLSRESTAGASTTTTRTSCARPSMARSGDRRGRARRLVAAEQLAAERCSAASTSATRCSPPPDAAAGADRAHVPRARGAGQFFARTSWASRRHLAELQRRQVRPVARAPGPGQLHALRETPGSP